MNSQFVTVKISNDVFAELMKMAEERRVSVRVVVADIIEDSVKHPAPVKVQWSELACTCGGAERGVLRDCQKHPLARVVS